MEPANFTFDAIEPRNRLLSHKYLNETPWGLLVNDTGLEQYACLLVPEPSLSQYVDYGDIESVVQFLRSEESSAQQVWIGYNSLGAGASVNSKHYQVLSKPDEIPLWNAVDKMGVPNEKLQNFPHPESPMLAWVYRDIETAESAAKMHHQVDLLQLSNIPFNMYFRLARQGDNVVGVIVPRRALNPKVFKNDWAICEIAGSIVLENDKDYNDVTWKKIKTAYQKTTYTKNKDKSRLLTQRPPKIAITGGTGFVGLNYLRYLLKVHPAYHIRVLARATNSELDEIRHANPARAVEFHLVDILTSNLNLKSAIEDVDRVVHLAAQADVWRVNVDGTQRIVDVIHEVNLARGKKSQCPIELLFLSTEQVYRPKSRGDLTRSLEDERLSPQNPYAHTKAAAEALVRHRGLDGFFIVRASGIYGPGPKRGMLATWITTALAGGPLLVEGQGEAMRDNLYVEDTVRGLDWVLHKARLDSVYNLSAKDERSILNTAREILDTVGKPRGQVGNKNGQEPDGFRLDASKVRSELGWQPSVSFKVGLRRTIDSYRPQLSSRLAKAVQYVGGD